MNRKSGTELILMLGLIFVVQACSAIQPPAANGPRTNEPLYPVLLTEDPQRRDASRTLFKQLVQRSDQQSQADLSLRSVTATVEKLPTDSRLTIYLPRIGTGTAMTEDEIRESLRRFINDWQGLLGADPSQLSLITRSDQPDGTKLGSYEQRAFRFPLRGGYGNLQIQFAADRRLINVASSCIPEAGRLEAKLDDISPQITQEEATSRLLDSGLKYVDSSGKELSYKPTASNVVNVRELVIYVRPAPTRTDALEFHLAWQIEIAAAPVKTAYLDAVNGQMLAAE